MIKKQGFIWEEYQNSKAEFKVVVIPTNGQVNRHNECVMGAGLAKQAKQRFPGLALELGKLILIYGNHLYSFPEYGLVTFPTKHRVFNREGQKEKSDINLIIKSAVELQELYYKWQNHYETINIFMPMVGCGNGELSWDIVEPILDRFFSESNEFILVDINYKYRISV